MQHHDSFARAIGWIAHLRTRSAIFATPWVMGALLFLIALALRLDIEALAAAGPFITFYVAIVPITLACGWRRGVAFAALSGFTAWYFFLRLSLSPGIAAPGFDDTLISVIGFAAVAGIEIAVSEALAQAAIRLSGGASGALAAQLAQWQRRANVSARFIAAPALTTAAGAMSFEDLAGEVRRRLDLFETLDAALLSARCEAEDWAVHMEAFCRAEVDAAGARKPLCHVSGDARGLDADVTLAISLAVSSMAREAIATRCSVFEAGLRHERGQPARLDVRATGCRAPLWEAPGTAPWHSLTQWLVQLLGADVTVAPEGEPGIRVEFPA